MLFGSFFFINGDVRVLGATFKNCTCIIWSCHHHSFLLYKYSTCLPLLNPQLQPLLQTILRCLDVDYLVLLTSPQGLIKLTPFNTTCKIFVSTKLCRNLRPEITDLDNKNSHKTWHTLTDVCKRTTYLFGCILNAVALVGSSFFL